MAEYIKREAALSAVDCGNLHKGIVDALQENIKDIPAADVVEVRHGRWILKDKSALDRKPKRGEEIFCDQCGEMALGYSFWECDLKPSNFCPNCGARMDGGADDD